MRNILAVITAIVVLISFIFALRQPIALVFLFASCAIPIVYVAKRNKTLAKILIIIGCMVSLLFVNSLVPIFGERYQFYKKSRDDHDRLIQERYQELNRESAREYHRNH
ncbi:hypothetical protein N8Q75_01365 [Enterobacter hormaechei subsp. hoffmannii]|uniref:hypothetical protein n=1 Tax=Enterobacter sp. 198 TaxID=1640346 RepID=UPI00125DAD4D|nr:hypothetical protein [Enterobacter sp. 198]KAB5484844.1 hypothetical protein F8561_00375 [Enterobacter sp. 198]MCU2620782.1 hypothetical protein [Enterobacter hormaechei subsp. hoffmannii]